MLSSSKQKKNIRLSMYSNGAIRIFYRRVIYGPPCIYACTSYLFIDYVYKFYLSISLFVYL